MMTIKSIDNKIIFPSGESVALEKKLVAKLDRIVKGVTQNHPKEDALLINEGKEGWGKTNSSIAEAVYLKAKTKRDIHLFFKMDKFLEFAKSTKEKIIIWDEPALDSLSTDQVKTRNKDLTRLFMAIRKRRHIFIINYTKFWKFPEYLIVDRSIGMVHMHSRKIGRFFYIRQKKLEDLWNDKRKKNKRNYRKRMSFGGQMPLVLEKHFSELGIFINGKVATIDDYENEKDNSIFKIGEEHKESKTLKKQKEKLDLLRYKIAMIPKKIKVNQATLASLLGVNPGRLREWKSLVVN